VTDRQQARLAAQACTDVTAVVVTYHPDLAQLGELLDILLAQVGRVVIVDNGSASALAPFLAERGGQGWELVHNRSNLGIATAQNLGVQRALEAPGCRYVLLCDQDSLPAAGMVHYLHAALQAPATGAAPLAAVGPWSVDRRSGARAVLVVDRGQGPQRWRPPPPAPDALPDMSVPAFDVAFLIASGTLIPVAALRHLRGMRGDYFIDHVDTEWCLRARAAGYRLAVVPQAQLRHSLGDKVRAVWFFGRREVAWHTPLRDYYMFRNTMLMLRDLPLAPVWRRHLLWRLLQYAGYFLLLGDQRRARLGRMLLGLRHGRAGYAGRLDPDSGHCVRIEAAALDPASAPAPGLAPGAPGGLAR
jgi:rhamnosyltransferase